MPSIMTKNRNQPSLPNPWVSSVFRNRDAIPLHTAAEPCRSNFFSLYLGPQDEWLLFEMRQHVYWDRKLIWWVWHRTKSWYGGVIGLWSSEERLMETNVCPMNYWVKRDQMCSVRRGWWENPDSLQKAGRLPFTALGKLRCTSICVIR